MAAEITFARDKDSGELKHISNVPRGKICNCVCLECGGELQAVKGGYKAIHFRHHNPNCKATYETALHNAAKEIIAKHTEIIVPQYGLMSYSNPIVEEQWNIYRPDIKIQTEYGQIFIEIAVSSFMSEAKEMDYLSNNVICFEIDLSSEDRDMDIEALKQVVLFELDNKTLFCDFKPTIKKPTSSNINSTKLEVIIALLIGLGVLLYNFFPKKRRN